METKINYTLVGLFVLLLGAAAIIIPLWLTSGLNQQQYTTYVVYMNEAVDGLSINSSVKYNGVDVGYVRDIQLNLQNTQQVRLLLNIKDGVPITTHTTATLQSQGITGVEYIGLKGGQPNGSKPLTTLPGQRYPEIKVAPSIKVRLDSALTQMMSNFNKLSIHLDQVFNDKNINSLSNSLQNIDKFSANISKQSAQIDQSISSLNTLIQSLNQSTQTIPDTVNQAQQVLQNLQTITNEVQENPSVLVRGKANPPLGPGEGKDK